MKQEVIWPVAVQNPVTKEWVRFSGQGKTVAEAVSDGIKNLQATYRPSSDGRTIPAVGIGVPPKCAVRLADGTVVCRKLEAFESEQGYDAATERSTLPECAPADYLNKPRAFQMDLSEGSPAPSAPATAEEPEMKLAL